MSVHVDWTIAESLLAKFWAAAGPLVGVLLGALLGRSWDRRKWLNDNRKEEYRELITALTDAAVALIERVQSDDGSHMMLVRKRADFIRARQDRYLKIDQGLARPLIHRCRNREDESV